MLTRKSGRDRTRSRAFVPCVTSAPTLIEGSLSSLAAGSPSATTAGHVVSGRPGQ
ncbi:MAG: hypothetical protein AB7N65_07365 [Vicinamibacterales bacterium]